VPEIIVCSIFSLILLEICNTQSSCGGKKVTAQLKNKDSRANSRCFMHKAVKPAKKARHLGIINFAFFAALREKLCYFF
jgi:hypothetical protein